MKQIKVNSKCNGCGLCIVNSVYLKENDDGNAQAIPGKAIKSSDLDAMKKIVTDCPEGALEIIETGTANTGKAGVNDVINALKKQCEAIKVDSISSANVKLNVEDYRVSAPYSIKENRRDYTSESSARSAAKDEFNRLCYSENAYRPIIKKVFVEYKVNVLKPYYNCQDEPDSAYYKYNEMVRKYLADAYAEICDLVGENKVPSTWKNFSFYLKEKDWSIQILKEFDERSTSSGIITALKDLSNTSLSDYVSYMDFDYDEEYAGEGLLGKTKYKNMWYFSGFNSAAKSFMDDLTWAIGYMSSDIEEAAVEQVNFAFKTFEEELKKEFSNKIEELKKYV